MSQSGDEGLARLVADLARSLRDLQRELDERGGGPPTPGDLLRFTDEVAIPGLILLLETNVRALRLLQRAIRIADGRDRAPSGRTTTAVEDRASRLGRDALEGLDAALAEVQSAIEGRPPDDEARRLLAETRRLRQEVDERLAEGGTDRDGGPRPEGEGGSEPDRTAVDVPVDVEAELESIKDELDDGAEGGDGDGDDDSDDPDGHAG